MKYEFTLPLPPRGLSPNVMKGRHFGGIARMKQEYIRACLFLILHAQTEKHLPTTVKTPCILNLIFCYSKGQTDIEKYHRSALAFCRDDDNAIGSFKSGRDALKISGLITDDSAKHLRIGTVQLFTTAKEHKNRACILVELVEIEEP